MQQDRHEVVLEANITNFKNKMKEAQNISKEVGKKISDNTKFNVWQNGVMTLSNGTQLVKKSQEELNQKIEDTGEVSKRAGTEISTAFNKGLKSVKKLTLGFLGARSAFGLFKKYMSEYSNQNEAFAQKMQLTTNVITNALAPAFEFFGNIIQYVVIGLAKVVELLFGVNILGKTVDNSLKGASKSAKELNENLSGLDEISNIDQSAGGLSTGIGGQLEALDEFQKKIKEVEELFNKWKVTEKLATIKKFLKDIWNSGTMQLIRNLIGDIVDWSIKHPNAVATILGGIGLTKLISSIMGTAGGTGLLGLVGNIKYLAGLGAIALTITLIYEGKKELNKWFDDTVDEMTKNTNEIVEKVEEGRKHVEKAVASGDEQAVQGMFDKRIEIYDETMKNLQKLRSYSEIMNSFVGKGSDFILGSSGRKEMIEDIEKITDATKDAVLQYRELYKSGMLTPEQEETYRKLISATLSYNDVLKMSKDEMNDLIDDYMELKNTPTSIENMSKAMKQLGYSEDEIREKLTPYFDELKNNFGSVSGWANDAKNKIINVFSKPIPVQLTGDTSLLNTSLKTVFGKFGNVFNALGIKLPSYDVGTDYVPKDQIAMVHEGERIIPKKYNNSQYMGNDETNSLLIELNKNVLELANKPTTLNVNGKELAKATYSDFQEENSRRGSNMSVRRV